MNQTEEEPCWVGWWGGGWSCLMQIRSSKACRMPPHAGIPQGQEWLTWMPSSSLLMHQKLSASMLRSMSWDKLVTSKFSTSSSVKQKVKKVQRSSLKNGKRKKKSSIFNGVLKAREEPGYTDARIKPGPPPPTVGYVSMSQESSHHNTEQAISLANSAGSNTFFSSIAFVQ